MALKTILLRSKLDALNNQLEGLKNLDADFEARETELINAVDEMTAETPEEDRAVIESQAEALDNEKADHEEKKKRLQEEIAEIERQIADEEAKQKALEPVNEPETKKEERTVTHNKMENRTKFFGMSVHERDAFFAREDVKDFLTQVRSLAGKESRGITGGALLIPEVMLDLVRENIFEYSKLIRRVRFRVVAGKAREPIMGVFPEAVWMEACGNLNELEFTFYETEVDGYKLGGYVPICNALLEDNDINLAGEIITGLGQAIGLALDKAILYGDGKKKPLGIVSRLAQTSEPADYSDNNIPWVDYHSTHIARITGTGTTFFSAFAEVAAKCKGKYSRGIKFWAMNETTYASIQAKAIAVDMAGAYVSQVNGVMPIVGGDIVVLDFIPDNDVIGGYGDLYLLVERAGMRIEQSRDAMFTQDKTVVRGVGRYDGTVVIPEGFVCMNINNSSATTSTTFANDEANDATLEDLQVAGASLSPTFASNTYEYTVNVANNISSVSVYATPSQDGADVVIKKGTKKYVDGAAIPMTVGDNTVTATVSMGAQTLTYTVVITRAGV